MSMPRREKIKCPKCGQEIEFTLWQSINTEMEFAVPDIISGKLFEVRCDACGFKTRVDYPFLFNDMHHNVMIYYTEPGSLKGTIDAARIVTSVSRCRVVTSQETMREKAAIFNGGLDDRIVELLKLFVLNDIEDQLKGEEVNSVFFHNDRNGPRLELVFDGRASFVNLHNLEAYKTIEEQFRDRIDARPENDFVVDQDWALSFLEEYICSLSIIHNRITITPMK